MIRPEDLLLDHSAPIGGSRNGIVFKATWKHSGLVAVKILAPEVSFGALRDYIDCLGKIKHPNVLEILGYSPATADPLFLVTAYQACGNARQFLGRKPNASRAKIVYDVALGMQFLHSRGMIHGSLSPTNVLIRDDGRACIGDCGAVQLQSTSNKDAHRYYSPEAWKGTVSRSSDVFAFAMSALEIFTSSLPWGVLAASRIYQLVVQQDLRPDCPEPGVRLRVGLTDHIWGILEESWHKESRLRPNFDHIVRMWNPDDRRLERNKSRPLRAPIPAPSVTIRGRSASLPERQRGAGLRLVKAPAHDTGSIRSLPRHPISTRGEPSSASSFTLEYSSNSSLSDHSPMTPHSGTSLNPYANADTAWDLNSNYSNPSLDVHSVRNLHKAPSSEELPPGSYSHKHPVAPPGWSSQAPPLRPSTPPAWGSPPGVGPAPPRPYHHASRPSEVQSMLSSDDRVSNLTGTSSVLVVGALQAEVKNGHHPEIVDNYLARMQSLAQQPKMAEKLVTAGAIPTVIDLLKQRAGTGAGLEIVLGTLGALCHDSLSANSVIRSGTVPTLIEIFTSSVSDAISSLTIWCISRLCRSNEVISTLLKANLIKILLHNGLSLNYGNPMVCRHSALCLGNLVWSDSTAEALIEASAIPALVGYVTRATTSEDLCAGLYAIARTSRSIKIAKQLAKAGIIPILAEFLSTSDDPHILNWTARTVGCLMRPNSSDIAKMLLDAGIANGLARLPRVLHDEVEPLGSFAFAVQRFSAAEWGGGTRQKLVDAGVVDSLLAALRTASDEPYPQVHIELALAASFLCDVGGASLRKEIINAGGVDILKRVGAEGDPEVAKACNMAVTSITGNLWTRNAAGAKTALKHNWSGGCPQYQPPCPVPFVEQEQNLDQSFANTNFL